MLNSKHIFRTIYFLTVGVLAVTTFTSGKVYGSWWFVTLLCLFTATVAAGVIRSRLWKTNIPALMLHAAILLVLAGGFFTWSCSERGTLRLEPGQETSRFSGGELPFTIALESFEVRYYPGGTIPQDYISTVLADGQPYRISMNRILKKQGYRFYQTSYDASGATILSVNHDPVGITVTYCGYIMFLAGGVLSMLRRRGNFRKLTSGLGVVVLMVCACGDAGAATISGITRSQADSLAARQVLYGGQVVTFNTLSREFVKKLYGKPTYRGLTSEQVLGSMLLYPEEWSRQPIIQVKNKALCRYLGAEGNYISFSELFDEAGLYRLNQLYADLDSKYNRAITSLDEKAGLIMTLYTGELIVPRSDDDPSLSRLRIGTELLYNRIPFSMLIFIILFIGALTAFACTLGFDRVSFITRGLLAAALLLQTICFGMQWILSGHIPLSNTYETLEFIVILFLGLTALLGRRFGLLLPLGMLLGGVVALVAHLNATNPIVTPLMPVLASPWLSIHVMCVISSYSLLVLTFAVSVGGLCSQPNALRFMTLNSIILYPATLLLAAGIFAGSVWANVSWGRYWAWDPKETWALITLMYYVVPLHRNNTFSDNPKRFHIYMVCGVAAVLMTYFGVNFMSSLHSYGG